MKYITCNIAVAMLLCGSALTVNAGHTNTVLVADLNGAEEVDSADPSNRLPGDPDGMGEAYVFGIDGDPTTLCYVLLVDHIQLVPVGEGMAAHIHEGGRFTNGPVVAVMAGPEDGNAADCLTEGEAGKFPTEEAGIVQRILENPEDFYVNVHNPEYPAGAIRGTLANQIKDDHDHDHDDANAPSVPVNLTSLTHSGTAVEVIWDRSTDDGIVVAYIVYRDGVEVAQTEGPNVFDDSLSPGTSYRYEVVAVDEQGNQSGRSTSLSVTTNDH